MKKSIFLKTFAAITVFGVIILMIFSGIISTYIYQYSTNERRSSMENDAIVVGKYISLLSYNAPSAMQTAIRRNVEDFASERRVNILITDSYGKILLDTDSTHAGLVDTVDQDIMRQVLTGNWSENRGTLGGYYQSNVTTVSTVVSSSSGEMTNAVFLSTDMPYAEGMLHQLSKIMINATIIVLIISIFVSYIVTSEVIRPLKTMYNVVKEYGKGDFSKRMPVDGQDEVSQLAIAFNDMAFNLERMNDTRNNFISNVSHDLKTPMTTIGGFIDGMLDGTIPPDKQQHYLKIVSDEVRRLSRLVRELLDVQRFESGIATLNKTKFNLCELASTVLIGFEQQINAKNLYIEVHFEKDSMEVIADRDMIFRVIYNLLDNAVKFVNENGIISVTISTEGKKARCHVRNTGDGISSEEIKHIFDRFYKADSSRGLDKRGYGLGLFIVRSIISAHEESINVDSCENAYVDFNFTLPLA